MNQALLSLKTYQELIFQKIIVRFCKGDSVDLDNLNVSFSSLFPEILTLTFEIV